MLSNAIANYQVPASLVMKNKYVHFQLLYVIRSTLTF